MKQVQVTIGPAQIYNHGNGLDIGVAVRESEGYSNIRNFSGKAWEDLLLDSNLDEIQKAVTGKNPLARKHVVELEKALDALKDVEGSSGEIFKLAFSDHLLLEESVRKARLRWLHYWVLWSVNNRELAIIHVL